MASSHRRHWSASAFSLLPDPTPYIVSQAHISASFFSLREPWSAGHHFPQVMKRARYGYGKGNARRLRQLRLALAARERENKFVRAF